VKGFEHLWRDACGSGALWKVGVGMSVISTFDSGYNYFSSDRSFGRAGKLGVSVISNTMMSVKHPAVVGMGVTISIIDYYGGFNETYKTLDYIDFNTEHRYINAINYIFNGAYFNK